MMGIKERNSHTLPEDICLEVAFGVPRVLRVDRAGVRGGWAGAGRGAVLRCHQGGRQCLGRDSIPPRFYVEEHLGELFAEQELLRARSKK
jgi:hypothetical protein